jgi:hypothetical protein
VIAGCDRCRARLMGSMADGVQETLGAHEADSSTRFEHGSTTRFAVDSIAKYRENKCRHGGEWRK